MKDIRGAGKRSRKAVSPVVATVILVLISVVAGVMLWLWVSGFTSAATAQQPALYERIKIEAVRITNDNRVNATVRNVGSVTVNITDIYVLNASGVVVASGISNSTPSPPNIDPGSVAFIASNAVTSPSRGYSYTVKVVTKNGVEASYTFVWP
jgi:flagellin-like protein